MSVVGDAASTVTSVVSLLTLVRVVRVGRDVKTGNALTIGQLSDATESRRIDHIPEGDRTKIEKDHISTLPVPEKGGG